MQLPQLAELEQNAALAAGPRERRPEPSALSPLDAAMLSSTGTAKWGIKWLASSASYGVFRWRCRDTSADARREKMQSCNLLTFPHEGSFRLRSRAGTALVGPNEVGLFVRAVPYQTEHPCGCGDHGSGICLSDELLASLLEDWKVLGGRTGAFPYVALPVSPPGMAALARLLSDLREGSVAGSLELDERVTSLLSMLVAPPLASGTVGPRAQAAVVAACETLQRRYADPIRLADLAAEAGLTRFHFCRVFKATTGLSIDRYRARLRIQVAWTRLLDDPDQDLSALAHELGFSGHSYFGVLFRRYLGLAPSAMRRDVRRSRAAVASGAKPRA